MTNNIDMVAMVEELDQLMINFDLTPAEMITALDTYAKGLEVNK